MQLIIITLINKNLTYLEGKCIFSKRISISTTLHTNKKFPQQFQFFFKKGNSENMLFILNCEPVKSKTPVTVINKFFIFSSAQHTEGYLAYVSEFPDILWKQHIKFRKGKGVWNVHEELIKKR